MELFLRAVFFASAGLILYVYFGYPLLLLAVGRFRRREVRRGPVEPSVTLIIAAYNEEAAIREKIANTLALDYPPERLGIVVASDGSTDGTVAIAREFGDERLSVLDLPRHGKVMALNRAASAATGEILVFTDANAVFEREALRRLVSNFADSTVGGVCGNQRYRRTAAGDSSGDGENLYWKYDKFIKRLESRIGSTVAADGSIYAIRAKLFEPLADPAQADDHAISSRVVTGGMRLVLDETAVSYEEPPAESDREFRRKVRVTNHTFSAILNLPEALDPRVTGFYAVELLSHKLLRYAVPFLMIAAFFSNLLLAGAGTVFRLLLLAQMLFYLCALAGRMWRAERLGRFRLFYVPYYFCLANAAALLGVLSRLKGERFVIWQPRGETSPVIPRR
jgi:cellulose synthase/poly-beta-1,6-N-acetylglucosamine synthase-like glycosyltransferase